MSVFMPMRLHKQNKIEDFSSVKSCEEEINDNIDKYKINEDIENDKSEFDDENENSKYKIDDKSKINEDIENHSNNNCEDFKEDLDFFNNSTCKHFIAKYASYEDSTPQIISFIKNIPISKTDKLIRYTTKLSNFNIQEIANLTNEKNRIFRQISSRLVYGYILFNFKEINMGNINILFKNVFLRRHRDVDPIIRSYSYDFLIDFISLNTKMFNKHTSLLNKALNDKQDIVRKTILTALRRKKMLIDEKKIILIAKNDKNKNVRLEAILLILELIKIDKMNNNIIFEILNCHTGQYKLDNKNFNKLLEENICKMLLKNKMDTIHNLINNCPDYVGLINCEYFECQCIENCYFKIIEKQKKCLKITELYDFYKTNLNSIISIVNLLIFSEIDNTEILINFIEEIIKYIKHNNNLVLFDKLCEFFKKVENDYKSIIENSINKVFDNREYKTVIIKYFDIEECVTENDYLETQIYKNLWDIINEDFGKITRINKQKYDVLNIKDVCNLLLYIHSQIKENLNFYIKDDVIKNKQNHTDLSINNNCQDKSSALKILYFDLIEVINFDDINLLDFLYKFNEENICEEQIYLIYKFIENVDDFSNIFSISKNKSNLVNSFFKFLSIFDFNKFPCIPRIAKIINSKFKNDNTKIIINNLKNILVDKDIPFLDIFISKLNINECIVLENICKEGKVKDALNSRINKTKGFITTEEENITYL